MKTFNRKEFEIAKRFGINLETTEINTTHKGLLLLEKNLNKNNDKITNLHAYYLENENDNIVSIPICNINYTFESNSYEDPDLIIVNYDFDLGDINEFNSLFNYLKNQAIEIGARVISYKDENNRTKQINVKELHYTHFKNDYSALVKFLTKQNSDEKV